MLNNFWKRWAVLVLMVLSTFAVGCAKKDTITGTATGPEIEQGVVTPGSAVSIWQNARGAVGGSAFSAFSVTGITSSTTETTKVDGSNTYSRGQMAVMSADYVYICNDNEELIVYEAGIDQGTGISCQGDPALSADGSQVFVPQSDEIAVTSGDGQTVADYYGYDSSVSVASSDWIQLRADSDNALYIGFADKVQVLNSDASLSKSMSAPSGKTLAFLSVNEANDTVMAVFEDDSNGSRQAYYYGSSSWVEIDDEVTTLADEYYGDNLRGDIEYISTETSDIDDQISNGVLYVSEIVTSGDSVLVDYSYRLANNDTTADLLDDWGLNNSEFISYPKRSDTTNPLEGSSQVDLLYPRVNEYSIAGSMSYEAGITVVDKVDSYGGIEGIALSDQAISVATRYVADNDNLMIASADQNEAPVYQSYASLMERRALTMYLEYCYDVSQANGTNCSWYGRGFLFESSEGEDYTENLPGDTNSVVIRTDIYGDTITPVDTPYEYYLYLDQIANEWSDNGSDLNASNTSLPYISVDTISYAGILNDAKETADYVEYALESPIWAFYDSDEQSPRLGYSSSTYTDGSTTWDGSALGAYIDEIASFGLLNQYAGSNDLVDAAGTSIADYVSTQDSDDDYLYGSYFQEASDLVKADQSEYLLWKDKSQYSDRDLQFKTEVSRRVDSATTIASLKKVTYTDYAIGSHAAEAGLSNVTLAAAGLGVDRSLVEAAQDNCEAAFYIVDARTTDGFWDKDGLSSYTLCPNAGFYSANGSTYAQFIPGLEINTVITEPQYNTIEDIVAGNDEITSANWLAIDVVPGLEDAIANWPQQIGFGADYRWTRFGTIVSHEIDEASDFDTNIAGTQSRGADDTDSISPYNWYSEVAASGIVSKPVVDVDGQVLMVYIDKNGLDDSSSDKSVKIAVLDGANTTIATVGSIDASATVPSQLSPPLIDMDGNVYVFSPEGAGYFSN